MNYRHVYMLIIEHAKSEEKLGLRKKGNGKYYECHHILPKSLYPLWVKRKNNLVLLTAREHFFCHQLLTKIYPIKSMFFALYIMSNRLDKKSSREYEKVKLFSISELSDINSKPWDSRGWDESKLNYLKSNLSNKLKSYRQSLSEEEKEQISTNLSTAQKKRYALETLERKQQRLETWKKKDLCEHAHKIKSAQLLSDKSTWSHNIRLGIHKSEEAIIEYDLAKEKYNSVEAKLQRKQIGIEKCKETKSKWTKEKRDNVLRKMSESNRIAQANRTLSHRKHISESKLGEKNPMYGKASHNSQKVLYIEENLEFRSIRQLALYIKVKPQEVSNAIKNNNGVLFKRKRNKIYHFRLI